MLYWPLICCHSINSLFIASSFDLKFLLTVHGLVLHLRPALGYTIHTGLSGMHHSWRYCRMVFRTRQESAQYADFEIHRQDYQVKSEIWNTSFIFYFKLLSIVMLQGKTWQKHIILLWEQLWWKKVSILERETKENVFLRNSPPPTRSWFPDIPCFLPPADSLMGWG